MFQGVQSWTALERPAHANLDAAGRRRIAGRFTVHRMIVDDETPYEARVRAARGGVLRRKTDVRDRRPL